MCLCVCGGQAWAVDDALGRTSDGLPVATRSDPIAQPGPRGTRECAQAVLGADVVIFLAPCHFASGHLPVSRDLCRTASEPAQPRWYGEAKRHHRVLCIQERAACCVRCRLNPFLFDTIGRMDRAAMAEWLMRFRVPAVSESSSLAHLLFRAGRRQAGDNGPGLCSVLQCGQSGSQRHVWYRQAFCFAAFLVCCADWRSPRSPGPGMTEMPVDGAPGQQETQECGCRK